MRLFSNRGKMLITLKAQVTGYNPNVWFDQEYITNLSSLNNLIKQYCITYDSLHDMFIVHQEEHGKKKMHLRMHEIGLHYYEPEDENFVFVKTVTGYKENYRK